MYLKSSKSVYYRDIITRIFGDPYIGCHMFLGKMRSLSGFLVSLVNDSRMATKESLKAILLPFERIEPMAIKLYISTATQGGRRGSKNPIRAVIKPRVLGGQAHLCILGYLKGGGRKEEKEKVHLSDEDPERQIEWSFMVVP